MEIAVLNRKAEEIKDDVIQWRRHIHRNPELSFHEERTSQFIEDTLRSFGNLEISRPTPTSVMARLIGAQPGKVLAIRADMDALPMQEENTFEYASQNSGVMHACGHDGNTATLLGTAKILSGLKDQLHGEVRFLFQHAEELFPGGAQEMVAAGVMEGVDVVLGMHMWATLPIGKVGIVYGPMTAAPDTFWITINGKGGHAAMPHETIDPIATGAQIISNLQHIVSRNVDPMANLVLSITQFGAGNTHNIIPEYAKICGTVRSFDPELRKTVPVLMERIVKGITEAHGASYEMKYENGYSAVINPEEVTRVVENTAWEAIGKDAVERMKPNMGGEDFSAFMQKAPGCYFYVGAGNVEKGITYPHHHPHFNIDENALEIGVKMYVNAAFKLLG